MLNLEHLIFLILSSKSSDIHLLEG
ncbi:unnamed protein product [Spirodela intermedia]|uniref:Uncharacterized protein n=2 Tax=Spirodela intermedia TaxID=51605 RepID=A0A7I8IZG5_SPIIN|nr:unnamed protein product [Spirodela intermedia]CAA6663199.1 unnamed protein product [Spirodela intermedia]CAA7399643.1 unnamed protein product [Spirodela intermedia]